MKAYRIAVVIAACLLAHAARADAQQLTILSAREDAGKLVVSGGLFADGIRVFVALNELTVRSVSPTEIHATLPTLNSGTYLLIVFQPATSRLGTFLYAHAASGSVPLVLDHQGQVVGTMLDASRVIRQVNGVSVRLDIALNGFQQLQPSNVDIIFKTSDCTGTPYFAVGEPSRVGRIAASTIYYASEPIESFIEGSARTADESIPCGPRNPSAASWFGPLATAPLPSFTPPFRIP